MITPTEIKQNEQIRTYIEKADEALAALGYTEHSYPHGGAVPDRRLYARHRQRH